MQAFLQSKYVYVCACMCVETDRYVLVLFAYPQR